MAIEQLLGTDKVSPTGKNKINAIATKLLGGYPGQVLVSQGTGSDDPEWQDVPNPFYADTAGAADFANEADEAEIANSIDADGVTILSKVVNIGVWNMESTPSINVAHGIADFTKILLVSVVIINDAGNTTYPTAAPARNSSYTTEVGIQEVGSTNIVLYRPDGGLFDSVTFDDGTMNRGKILITYQS